jgi:hypothetical protein
MGKSFGPGRYVEIRQIVSEVDNVRSGRDLGYYALADPDEVVGEAEIG